MTTAPLSVLAGRSDRLALAEVAREAALAVPGVLGTDAGPSGLVCTADGALSVPGVLCVATRAGGYDVSLRLVCGLVPLHATGEQVQRAVARAARALGLPVARIAVEIADVADPMKV